MKKIFAISIIFLFANLAMASLIGNYGSERSGVSGMTFLKIAPGARAEGMGGAFVGVGGDASALFSNPAGLGRERHCQLLFSHLDWPADINYDLVGITAPLTRSNTLGLLLGRLHTRDMPVRTLYQPGGNGSYFSYGDDLVQLTWASSMTDHFTSGLSLKYARETLDDVSMSTVLLDMGTYYLTGYRDLTLAVTISNFGLTMKPGGTYETADAQGEVSEHHFKTISPPTVFKLGSSMHVWSTDKHSLLCSIQVDHPTDNNESYHLGSELDLFHVLQLRGGWKIFSDEQSWTAGIGLNLHWRRRGLHLNWAYGDFGVLGETRRMSVLIDW